MSETKQVTTEELQGLQRVVEQYENISFRIGQYTMEIEAAKQQRAEMIAQATSLLGEREDQIKALEDKYGAGYQINIQTGELVKNG